MKKRLRVVAAATALLLSLLLCAVPAFAKTATGQPIVVSMGDSYAGGEGVDPYYGQDSENKFYDQDWIAHRSQNSWAGQLVINDVELKTLRAVPVSYPYEVNGVTSYSLSSWSQGSWFFVAESAASIKNVIGQYGAGYLFMAVKRNETATTPAVDYTAALAPQIDVFTYINNTYGAGSTDYVTIMMGAKDFGLPDLMIEAASSISFSTRSLSRSIETHKTDFLNSTIYDLEQMLKDIKQAAGANAKIIVVGYPQIFSGSSGSLTLSRSEMTLIDNTIDWLNNQISNLVDTLTNEGYTNLYYVSIAEAFTNHGYNTRDTYLNGMYNYLLEEDVDNTGATSSFSFASLHPNAKGAAAIAAQVQTLINDLDAGSEIPINPESPAGWSNENGNWMYRDAAGRIVTSSFITDDGSLYYVDSNGYRIENRFFKLNGATYYAGQDGKIPTNTRLMIDGAYYFFDASGKVRTNTWIAYEGNYYYLDNLGNPKTNTWATYNQKYYHLDAEGRVETNAWVDYNGARYYVGANGTPLVSSWVEDGGAWYYLNWDGTMRTSNWVGSGSTWYYVGMDGKCLTSSWVDYNDARYYVGEDGKAYISKWVQVDGNWYYLGSDAKMVRSQRIQLQGRTYYFNESGVCTNR